MQYLTSQWFHRMSAATISLDKNFYFYILFTGHRKESDSAINKTTGMTSMKLIIEITYIYLDVIRETT